MKVVSLSPEFEKTYCSCLEEWSEDIKEAGDHKARWLDRMRERGFSEASIAKIAGENFRRVLDANP